jgi:hypothetical protein
VRPAGTALAALALLISAVACGDKTIDAGNAAETVTRFVSERTGFEPDDVECPDDVKAEVGRTFECNFTGPEGPYEASVEITAVEGDDATFEIETRRAD